MAAANTCPDGTIQVKDHVCAICPKIDHFGLENRETVALQQSPYAPRGSTANDAIYRSQTSKNHSNKAYCGNEPYIINSTLYSACHPLENFNNPYHYKSLGSSFECFQQGKGIGGSSNQYIVKRKIVVDEGKADALDDAELEQKAQAEAAEAARDKEQAESKQKADADAAREREDAEAASPRAQQSPEAKAEVLQVPTSVVAPQRKKPGRPTGSRTKRSSRPTVTGAHEHSRLIIKDDQIPSRRITRSTSAKSKQKRW